MPGSRKLGRATDCRTAMLRGLVTYLLDKGRIETTVARAKDVRSMTEKMITLGKEDNLANKRQLAIKQSFPDALDMLLICVQAGMSIEAAFGKVSKEITTQSLELAEELSLTTAELSYLQDRRQAYDNLGKRTGIPGVKAVATSLIQAERYGTPVGQALRVMAKENREIRMAEAEKKAAALPPKLTVPMIVFFLPVLFLVILGPAAIRFWGYP